MDVVYVVKQGDRNEELRHSLRSLVNLPHERVWIAGYKPRWVTSVEYVPVHQCRSKWENSTANLLAACADDGLSDRFAFFNDDFHVVERIDAVPVLHGESFDTLLAAYCNTKSRYANGMRAARELLASLGHEAPLSYELHVPVVLEKSRVLELFDEVARHGTRFSAAAAIAKRTLYGNAWSVGGVLAEDVKVYSPGDRWAVRGPFVSTTQGSFQGSCGNQLRAMFPNPGPYETP